MAPHRRPGTPPRTPSAPVAHRQSVATALPFGCLVLALGVASLPLGSARPWAISLLALLLWAGLLVLLAGGAARPRSPATLAWWPRLQAAVLPLALLAALAALMALQLAPWPADWRAALAPATQVPGRPPVPGPLSADPFATQTRLITTLAFLAAFALVVALVQARRHVLWLLGVVAGAAVLQAMLAIWLEWRNQPFTFFFHDFVPNGRARGTFANPDHLAGAMVLGLSAGIGLLVALYQPGGAGSARAHWRTRAVAALQWVLSPSMLLRLLLVLCVVALVMTHSRMGNAAFLLAMLGTGALVATISPRLRKPALWLVASLLVIDLVIIGQWVGLERVVNRIQGTVLTEEQKQARAESALEDDGSDQVAQYREETLEARMYAPRATLRMAQAAPWLGHGAGSFASVFPAYKTPEVLPGFFPHAHNDYAEQAAETGWAGLALWLGVGLVGAVAALRLLRDASSPAQRGAGVAVTMATLAFGLHSMVDFNLQVPANALVFTTLMALALAAGRLSGETSRTRTRS